MTYLYFDKQKKKKRERKKKILSKLIHHAVINMYNTNEKRMMRRFQCYLVKRCLGVGRHHTYCLFSDMLIIFSFYNIYFIQKTKSSHVNLLIIKEPA